MEPDPLAPLARVLRRLVGARRRATTAALAPHVRPVGAGLARGTRPGARYWGDCYRRAAAYVLAHAPGGDPGPPPRCLILVHGRCHAGPVAWGHAWVELPAGLVFDGVRQQFYDGAGYRHALGAVAEAAYGPAAAAAWLRATGHWGPWHRGPAEGCPDPARLDARPPAPAGWAGARAPPAGPARAAIPVVLCSGAGPEAAAAAGRRAAWGPRRAAARRPPRGRG